jgi:hypothetical protein
MATYKNISGDWTITVDGGVGTIYINGNLDVAGNITYVSDIAVNDAFIVVAANNTGTVNNMGLVATKIANVAYAGLRFDVTANAWQISSSVLANGAPVAAYANLATGGAVTAAGANTQIQFNNGGVLGANASLSFDFANTKLTLSGHEVLGNIGTTPAVTANSVAIYNKAVGIGATGLYVVGTDVNDEVISATRARLYSIIF